MYCGAVCYMNIYQYSNLVKLYLNLLIYILLRINYNSIKKKECYREKHKYGSKNSFTYGPCRRDTSDTDINVNFIYKSILVIVCYTML